MAPLPVQCYGLCSISISGVLKVMDNVEGNYREGIHAREGVEHGRRKLVTVMYTEARFHTYLNAVPMGGETQPLLNV